VEKGCKEFMQKGPLGFPVTDVQVTLKDGQNPLMLIQIQIPFI
jgi:translation elongation factor EF-G